METKSAVEEAIIKYKPSLLTKETTGEGDESIAYIYDNQLLNRLSLASYRRFTIRFLFRKGILIEKGAQASVEGCRVDLTERLHKIAPAGLEGKSHFSTIPARFRERVSIAYVIDNETYDESLKRSDWEFDLDYLTDFGKCLDARSILPAISK